MSKYIAKWMNQKVKTTYNLDGGSRRYHDEEESVNHLFFSCVAQQLWATLSKVFNVQLGGSLLSGFYG
jgi:hypothetical protein